MVGFHMVYIYTNKYGSKSKYCIRPTIDLAGGLAVTVQEAKKRFTALKIQRKSIKKKRTALRLFLTCLVLTRKKLQFVSYLEQENPDWRGLDDSIIQNGINDFSKKHNIDMSDISPDDFKEKESSWWDTVKAVLNNIPGNVKLDKNMNLLGHATKIVNGHDVKVVKELIDSWEASAIGKTGLAGVQDALATSAPYMMHFFIGTGAGITKFGGQMAVKAIFKNPENINKIASGMVRAMGAGTALTATVFQNQIAEDVEAEKTYATFDGKGNYTVKNSDLSSTELLVKHSLLTWVAVMSEYSGGALKHIPFVGKFLSRGMAKAASGKGIISRGINTVSKLSRRTQMNVAFDGPAGEMFEEAMDNAGQFFMTKAGQIAGVDLLESINVDNPFMDKNEFKTTAAVIAIQSAFFGLPNGAARMASLKSLHVKDMNLRSIYDSLQKTPELVQSKQMMKGFIREGIGDTVVTVNARSLVSAFQENHKEISIKDALGLDQTTDELIKSQAAINGSVYIEADKLLVDSANPEVFETLMNLAEDIPGGTTLQKFEETSKAVQEISKEAKAKIANMEANETALCRKAGRIFRNFERT